MSVQSLNAPPAPVNRAAVADGSTAAPATIRIAWIGVAREGGGVPGMGALLLENALCHGAQIDFFTHEDANSPPKRLADHPNLTIIRVDPHWQWGRWYSRKPFHAFVSSTFARARAHGRLCDLLIQRNREKPYDCVFQLSQTELFKLGNYLDELPPVVVYPCVHAAGELRWHRRESAYARQSEHWAMHYLVRGYLHIRAFLQKREMRKPAMVIGMSRRFNELVAQDYGIDARRQAVVYHPIATAGQPLSPLRPSEGRLLKALFIARISVRKGVEQIVELSRRLDDLAGRLEIVVIGDRTQWSDYRKHLKSLNPRIARYVGGLGHDKIMAAYEDADLLVLPSHYEPGGIVIGEALSRGLPIVASDEVGSAEPVDARCCRRFPSGDIDAFEHATRQLIADLTDHPSELRALASEQARVHFSPEKVAGDLLENLRSARK